MRSVKVLKKEVFEMFREPIIHLLKLYQVKMLILFTFSTTMPVGVGYNFSAIQCILHFRLSLSLQIHLEFQASVMASGFTIW